MKIYATRTRKESPKYTIVISDSFHLNDEAYESALAYIYTTLAPYNSELNILCKSIKFDIPTNLNVKCGTYDTYALLLHPNTSTAGLRLVELTRQRDPNKAIKILVNKLVAELPDYIEEVLPEVQKSQARSKTVTARALLCKLLAKQFPGIQINKDYPSSGYDSIYIDNWSDYTDNEISQFAESLKRKYPTLNINQNNGYRYSRTIIFEEVGRALDIHYNRRINYDPDARFIYDKTTKTYIPYEE